MAKTKKQKTTLKAFKALGKRRREGILTQLIGLGGDIPDHPHLVARIVPLDRPTTSAIALRVEAEFGLRPEYVELERRQGEYRGAEVKRAKLEKDSKLPRGLSAHEARRLDKMRATCRDWDTPVDADAVEPAGPAAGETPRGWASKLLQRKTVAIAQAVCQEGGLLELYMTADCAKLEIHRSFVFVAGGGEIFTEEGPPPESAAAAAERDCPVAVGYRRRNDDGTISMPEEVQPLEGEELRELLSMADKEPEIGMIAALVFNVIHAWQGRAGIPLPGK
jgi:hypothetical protein